MSNTKLQKLVENREKAYAGGGECKKRGLASVGIVFFKRLKQAEHTFLKEIVTVSEALGSSMPVLAKSIRFTADFSMPPLV